MIVPMSHTGRMLLEKVRAEFDRTVSEVLRAEALDRGFDLNTVQFDTQTFTWVLPDPPKGDTSGEDHSS